MALAILGGLRRGGAPAEGFIVVEPHAPQRQRLQAELGIEALAVADASLAEAGLVVWAVKPQMFAEAAAPCAPFVGAALQLSIMAGIRSEVIVTASGSPRVVRAMPNTPALIGRGIAGLYAREAVTEADRAQGARAVDELAQRGDRAVEGADARHELDPIVLRHGARR